MRYTGQVDSKSYKYYLKSGGFGLGILLIFAFIFSIGSQLTGNWFIGQWALDSFGFSSFGYSALYFIIMVVFIVLYFVKTFMFGFFAVNSARNAFKEILWHILRKPMSYFDTTPNGQVVNYCVREFDSFDWSLPFSMIGFLDNLLGLIGSLVLAIAVTPFVIIIVIVDGLIFSVAFRKYIRTSTELKRLD